MSVKIIIDSTINVDKSLKDKYVIVPLSVHFGTQEYIDGVTIKNEEFYEKLKNCSELPTTSQPTPNDFEEVFKRETADGSDLVVLTISSKLSGTYQSANIAAEDFDNVYLVDTKSVSIGSGILAHMALQLQQQGKTAKEIADILIEERKNVGVIAMLDTLEYLKKGGRISKTVAFAGGLLSIKPIIGIEDGELKMASKARGVAQAKEILAKEIEKAGGIDCDKPYILGYSGNDDNIMKEFISENDHLWSDSKDELKISSIGSVVGAHSGPGAVAVAFFKNK